MGPPTTNNINNTLKKTGALSIADIKSSMKTQDQQFKRLQKMSQIRREQEMQNELNRLKDERS